MQGEQMDKVQRLVRMLAADATSQQDEQVRLHGVVTEAVTFLQAWHHSWARNMPDVASRLHLAQPLTPPFPEGLRRAVSC